jgi:hypothetical protein
MSILLLAAMMAAQAPTAVQPAAPVAQKEKPKQVCESIEITGSRSRQRVCHDVGSRANLEEYGVSDSAFGKTGVHSGAAAGGAPPQ